MKVKTDHNRREFIKKTGRVVVSIALAGTAGYLLGRQGTASAGCSNEFICSRCARQDRCKLPEAEDYKRSIRQISDENAG